MFRGKKKKTITKLKKLKKDQIETTLKFYLLQEYMKIVLQMFT